MRRIKTKKEFMEACRSFEEPIITSGSIDYTLLNRFWYLRDNAKRNPPMWAELPGCRLSIKEWTFNRENCVGKYHEREDALSEKYERWMTEFKQK